MGSLKEDWENDQYEDSYEKLAQHLGITKEELEEYGGEIQDKSSDDGVNYGNYIEFKAETPDDVLKRINGIDDNRTVYFLPSELEKIFK